MKNAKLIIVWSILLVVLIVAGASAYLWENGFFTDKNVAIATTQRGEVMHLVGSEAVAIVSQAKLEVGESLQTLDGESLITINENHFIWVKPNSKVTLSQLDADNAVLTLDSGSVWYMHINASDKQKFTLKDKLANVEPEGTKFFTTFDSTALTTSTVVIDGKVKVSDEFLNVDLSPFEKSYKTDIEGLRKIDLNEDDKIFAKIQLERDYAILNSARTTEINRHSTILNVVKEKFNLTDEIIQDTLHKLDTGELNEQQLIEQSPVPLPGLGRIREINAAAKETLLVKNNLQVNLSN